MNNLFCRKVFSLFNKKEKQLNWSTICAKTSFIIAFALLSLNTTHATKKAKSKKEKKTTKLSKVSLQWIYRAAGIGAVMIVARKGFSYKNSKKTFPINNEIEVPVIIQKQPVTQRYIQSHHRSSRKPDSKSHKKKKRKRKHNRSISNIDHVMDLSSLKIEKTDQQEQNSIQQPITYLPSIDEVETYIEDNPPSTNKPSNLPSEIKDNVVSKEDIDKVNLLQQGISLYQKALKEQKNQNKEAEKTFEQAEKLFQKARESVDKKSLVAAASYFHTGLCSLQKENGKEAVEHFRKTKKIYEKKLPESGELARTLFFMARGYHWQGDYKNAIKALDSAVKIYEKLGENAFLSEIALFKAEIYYEQKKYKKSIEEAKKAQEIHKKSIEEAQKNNQIGRDKINTINEERGAVAVLIGNILNKTAKTTKKKKEKKLKYLEAIKQYQDAFDLYKDLIKQYENASDLYSEKYRVFQKELFAEYIQDLNEKIEKLKSYYPEEFYDKPEAV